MPGEAFLPGRKSPGRHFCLGNNARGGIFARGAKKTLTPVLLHLFTAGATKPSLPYANYAKFRFFIG